MLRKKLLTLACAVGILAWGACFAPPYHPAPGEPPPIVLLRPLEGVHTLRIIVTNTSASHHMDPTELQKDFENQIELFSTRAGNRLTVQRDRAKADAVLEVAILDESATLGYLPTSPNTKVWPPSPRIKVWTVALKASSTLTSRDGKVLWSDPGEVYSNKYVPRKGDPPDIWQSQTLTKQLRFYLRYQVVHRMLFCDLTKNGTVECPATMTEE